MDFSLGFFLFVGRLLFVGVLGAWVFLVGFFWSVLFWIEESIIIL